MHQVLNNNFLSFSKANGVYGLRRNNIWSVFKNLYFFFFTLRVMKWNREEQ